MTGKSIDKYLKGIDKTLKKEGVTDVQKKDGIPNVAFGISLKSKKVAKDWDKVQSNLSKTLRSIFGNTDQNYRIIIAGHEKPNIKELNHDKVTWLTVKSKPPQNSNGYSGDKMKKRRAIGSLLRKERYSGYFMPVDADDWIHYRLVEYIRASELTGAFILRKGFMTNQKSNQIWQRSRFYKACGTCVVFYFTEKELPLSSKAADVRKTNFHLALRSHAKVDRLLTKANKNYKMIDYPFVTYVLGHGDNNSIIKGKKNDDISADDYRTKSETIGKWLYKYFKIN